MAPEEQPGQDATAALYVAPEDFVAKAPETNGGVTAPPEGFGVAGNPEEAREQALRGTDPRGEDAPEKGARTEPVD